MKIDPSIFRDYDIRAVIPDQLDEGGFARLTRAIIYRFRPSTIQIGRDMRITSPMFHKIFIREAISMGVNIVDLGLTSTDMLYFTAGKFNEDMAINISASHNPPEYNGMKIVQKGAVAVSGNSGLYDIRDLALSKKEFEGRNKRKGNVIQRDILNDFVKHVLTFIDIKKMRGLNVVVDTGNGMAGRFMPSLEKFLPWKVHRLFYELDGTFPNHVPSPIEEKNRLDCINEIKRQKADLGLVFDGDGDRVFMIDEKGRTLSGTIMTAIIAESLLKGNTKQTILYNAIVGRIVPEVVRRYKGKAIRTRVGHTLIKEDMRKYNALFCGEHSGHYYFKKNYYADSAIIAALLVCELMSVSGKKLSELLDIYDKYPSSEEINFIVEDKMQVMKKIEAKYKSDAQSTDWLDGITIWYKNWWLNVRPSNTEPLLRLNIEADDHLTLESKIKELVSVIESMGGKEKL